MTANPPSPQNQPPEGASSEQTSGNTKTGVLTLIVHHSITVLILVLVLVLAIWGYLNFRDAEFFATVDHDEFDAQLHPHLERAQYQRIQNGLEVYDLVYGNCPAHLDEIVETGLLVPSDLYYPRGPDSWTYNRHEDGLNPAADDDGSD